jgi:hypothetical protein
LETGRSLAHWTLAVSLMFATIRRNDDEMRVAGLDDAGRGEAISFGSRMVAVSVPPGQRPAGRPGCAGWGSRCWAGR